MTAKVDSRSRRANTDAAVDSGSAPGRSDDLRVVATRCRDAIRLTELGARAVLVSRLTGIDKAAATRLYQHVHGRPSPPGQLPFTDTWYRERARRMLHASIVWRLYVELAQRSKRAAAALIDTYECYRASVVSPLLDITRAAFVPRLVAMNVWQDRRCDCCTASYLSPLDTCESRCPGCRLYQRIRGRAPSTDDGCWPVGDTDSTSSIG